MGASSYCSHWAEPRIKFLLFSSFISFIAPFKGQQSKYQGRDLKVNSTQQPCLHGVKRVVKAEYKSYIQKPHIEANASTAECPLAGSHLFVQQLNKINTFRLFVTLSRVQEGRLNSFWCWGHTFNRNVKHYYTGSYWSKLPLTINIPD